MCMCGKEIYTEGAVIHQGLLERDSRGSLDQVGQEQKRPVWWNHKVKVNHRCDKMRAGRAAIAGVLG